MANQQATPLQQTADIAGRAAGPGPSPRAPEMHHPALPDTFDGTLYPPVTHDVPASYIVMELTLPVDDKVTASITAGSPFFKVSSIEIDEVQWTMEGGDEVPGHPKPQWVPDFTELGTSDGATPLAVKNGQYVIVRVALDVPLGSTPPGNVDGAVVLHGAVFSQALALKGTYLGVDLNSPIGRKWQAMGGDQTLGLVYGNAQPSPDGKGIVQQFANGWLYQTPSAQVFFMSNSVYAKWLSLATTKDAFGNPEWTVLGFPTEDTFSTVEGGQAIRFQGGAIVVRATQQAYVTYGAIYARYARTGNLSDPNNQPFLGLPVSDEGAPDPADGFRVSHFDLGDIYWSSATGAHEFHGAIRQWWLDHSGNVGYPITDETGTADGNGRFSGFQNGAVYWSPSGGAHAVRGPILSRWNALGAERSYLGYPLAEQATWVNPANSNAGVVASFQNGQIGWTAQDGTIDLPQSLFRTQPVVTADLASLGGWVNLTIWSNDNFSLQFHMHDSGLPDYDFQVRAIFTTPKGVCLVAEHSGHVEGTDSTTFTHAPNRDDDYSEDGTCVQRLDWSDIQNGQLWVTKDYSSTGVIGFFQDIGQALTNLAAGAVGGALGIVLGIGQEIGKVFGGLGLDTTFGVIAGVIVYAYTGSLVLAVVVGVAVGAVTDALIKTRQISDQEYQFADKVFKGTLPSADQIWLTNFSGLGGRAFTIPIGGRIWVNIGSAYGDPVHDTSYGSQAPGELLIHELTHVWQIVHRSFLPGFTCEAIVNGTNYVIGGQPSGVYVYGPPDLAWGEFGTEAQGALVDQWFGGFATVNAPNRTKDNNVDDTKHTTDPYFHYIQDNIRAGQT